MITQVMRVIDDYGTSSRIVATPEQLSVLHAVAAELVKLSFTVQFFQVDGYVDRSNEEIQRAEKICYWISRIMFNHDTFLEAYKQ